MIETRWPVTRLALTIAFVVFLGMNLVDLSDRDLPFDNWHWWERLTGYALIIALGAAGWFGRTR